MTTAAASDCHPSREEAAVCVGGLFERHGRMVYGICRAMLRDAHDAEDATQQVFLSAYTALLGGAVVRDPGGWLATIARNECRARIAAGMRRPLSVAADDLEAVPAVADEQLRQSQRDEIMGALAELPERQREAVILRYLHGLRNGEVATALGLSRPATQALLFRARRALRVSLRPAAVVLVVPAVVREELALALPGFEERTASAAVGAGLAGGVLAKLTAGSAGVKVATAAVAVSAVGAVGTVGPDRPATARDRGAAVPIERRIDAADVPSRADDQSGTSGASHEAAGDSSSAPHEDRDDRADDHDEADALDESRETDGDRTSLGPGSSGDGDDRTGSGSGSGSEPDGDPTSSGSRSGGDGAGDDEPADPADSSGHGSSGSADRSGSSGSGSGGSSRSGDGTSGSSGSSDEETDSKPDDD